LEEIRVAGLGAGWRCDRIGEDYGYAACPDHSPATHKKERHDQENGREAVGEKVEAHEPLLFLHARVEQSLRPILPILEKAIEIS
jgi:hypothetical protein